MSEHEIFTSSLELISVSSLLNDITNEHNRIILDPEYQRNIIWDDDKQRAFIESVFMNIVPQTIIFNNDTEKCMKTCIDGRQRLTTLCNFKNNKASHYHFRDNLKAYFDKVPAGENAESCCVLTPKEKAQFLNTKIPLVSYTDLTYQQQVNIFSRIQKGVALSAGELLIAKLNNETTANKFKELCDIHKSNLQSIFGATRDNHRLIIIYLMIFIDSNKPVALSKKKYESYMDKLTLVECTKKISLLNSFFDIILTDKLLLNHKVIIELINMKKNVLYTCIFAIFQKFKHNLQDIKAHHETIINTFIQMNIFIQMNDGKFDTNTTGKTLSEIYSKFCTIYDSLNDNSLSDNSSKHPGIITKDSKIKIN